MTITINFAPLIYFYLAGVVLAIPAGLYFWFVAAKKLSRKTLFSGIYIWRSSTAFLLIVLMSWFGVWIILYEFTNIRCWIGRHEFKYEDRRLTKFPVRYCTRCNAHQKSDAAQEIIKGDYRTYRPIWRKLPDEEINDIYLTDEEYRETSDEDSPDQLWELL